MLLPSGKMEQPLCIVLEDGRCYCQMADGSSHYVYCEKMADVIAKWQMELPLRVGDGAW